MILLFFVVIFLLSLLLVTRNRNSDLNSLPWQ